MLFIELLKKHKKAIIIGILAVIAAILLFIFFNQVVGVITFLFGLIVAKVNLAKKVIAHQEIIDSTNKQIDESKERQDKLKAELIEEGKNSAEIEKRMQEIDSQIKKLSDQQVLEELRKLIK